MFSEEEFTSRLEDLEPKMVITSDISINCGQKVNIQAIVNRAVSNYKNRTNIDIPKVIVYRGNEQDARKLNIERNSP
jgi:acyl-coenzyme A synthetase/AMP-(fatty) acid ligase